MRQGSEATNDRMGRDDGDMNMDTDFMANDDVAQLLIMQLGGGRAYARERRKAYRNIVSEIYSPPRLTGYLSRFPNQHLAPGVALDLTTIDPLDGQPWDFDVAAKRERARDLLRRQRPKFLFGSPVCTPWCTWQTLNAVKYGNEGLLRRERTRSLVHLNFLAELYREQMDGGRYFVHEHPQLASSWDLPVIQRLMDDHRVQRVRADQCQYVRPPDHLRTSARLSDHEADRLHVQQQRSPKTTIQEMHWQRRTVRQTSRWSSRTVFRETCNDCGKVPCRISTCYTERL